MKGLTAINPSIQQLLHHKTTYCSPATNKSFIFDILPRGSDGAAQSRNGHFVIQGERITENLTKKYSLQHIIIARQSTTKYKPK